VKCITTKFGLAQTVKLCLWEKGINTLKFFPRTYYINDISEMMDFLEDYKYTQAQAILN
jgi:tubulin monoglycylase TTLL3/8